MKITYITNSFFIYEFNNGKILVTDPWFAEECNQTWFHFPPLEDVNYFLSKSADAIYISHLHEDHLHPASLSLYDKSTLIIIGKLNTAGLKNKILSLGFNNIIEFTLGEKHVSPLGGELMIVSDFNGTKTGIETQLEYDLDTSLFIWDEKGSFVFNAIDNTLLPKNSHEIYKQHGSPDIAVIPYASASLYPMALLNFSDEEKYKASEKVKNSYMNIFIENALALKPKLVVPAGGEYILGGPVSHLAKFQPVPTVQDFKDAEEKLNSENIRLTRLFSGDCIDLLDHRVLMRHSRYRDFSLEDRNSYAKDFLSKKRAKFEETSLPQNFDFYKLLSRNSKNFFRAIENRGIKLDHIVILVIKHFGMRIIVEYDFSGERFSVLAEIKISNQKNTTVFTIESNLFILILLGQLSWNNLESSALIGMQRYPETYNPDVHEVMNFLQLS